MLQSIYCFHFYHRRRLNLFLPPYDSLKLNHDTKYLMTCEDTVEDPLMCVQFYIKSKVFSFRVTVHLLFTFLLQETLKSLFLPPYDSLKVKNDTNSSMTSEDTVEDPLMSVQFVIKSKVFHFVLQSIYCFHFYCRRRLNFYFYRPMTS